MGYKNFVIIFTLDYATKFNFNLHSNSQNGRSNRNNFSTRLITNVIQI